MAKIRILVVSDTHGNISRVREVYFKLEKAKHVDMLVHCGDLASDAMDLSRQLGVRVSYVKGNCDGSFDEDEFALLDTEAGTFLITHGHMQNINFSQQRLFYKVQENDCIGAFYGHTHRSAFAEIDGTYLINPGSISEPRDGSGGSFALVETSEQGVSGRIYSYDEFMSTPDDPTPQGGKPKAKVTGGHLRSLLNYSDRF